MEKKQQFQRKKQPKRVALQSGLFSGYSDSRWSHDSHPGWI